MKRGWFRLLALAPILTSWGCAMCASPYDYCGPTFTGNDCGDPCFTRERAGSVFDPAPVNFGTGYDGGANGVADERVDESPESAAEEDAEEGVTEPMGESPSDAALDSFGPAPGLQPQPDSGAQAPRPNSAQRPRVANTFRR